MYFISVQWYLLAADKYPEKTLDTNIGSKTNIIKAIKEQPDPD